MNETSLFLKGALKDDRFEQATRLVKGTTNGRAWLVGGYVYRTIIEEVYGTRRDNADLDFIIEKEFNLFSVPRHWRVETNRYGNPKISHEGCTIDLVPLRKVHSLSRRGLEPTILNYLSGTPLTVQSIAYDVDLKTVIGPVGKQAIRTRTVRVYDRVQAQYYADKKGMSVDELVRRKAESLGFKPVTST